MRDHPWDKPESAISLWTDARTEDFFRRYARLHVSMFPIFDAYAHQAAATGLPVIRHLLLEFPADPKAWDCNDEYMIGDRILVAPVIQQGATTRSLYLPQGAWTDYWTGKIVKGGRELIIAAPLEQIPIFVRAGSILPFISPDTETPASDLAGTKYRTVTRDIVWRVFAASAPASGNFTLADGTSARFTQNASGMEVKLEHAPLARRNEVIFSPGRPPKEVLLAGHRLPAQTAEESGWRWDVGTRTVQITFEGNDFDLRIQL
jgi:alpha-glucosidase (family GH31 glycosyl hydrolase)